MTGYTLNDHAKAAQDLARLHEKWENYSGNNTNKFRAVERSTSARPNPVTSSTPVRNASYRQALRACLPAAARCTLTSVLHNYS